MVDLDNMTHAAVYIDTSASMNDKMRVLNENDDNRSVSDFFLAGSGQIRRKIWDIAMDIWNSIIGHINVMPLTLRTIHSKGYSRTLKDIGRYSEHQHIA